MSIILFFVLTIVIGWGPWLLGGNFIIAAPIISAFVTAFITEGKQGTINILRGMVKKCNGFWILIAFTLPIILSLIGVTIYTLSGGQSPGFPMLLNNPLLVIQVIVFFMIPWISSAFLEEIGFRGYALEKVQKRFGPFIGTTILGLFFGAWLLPEFLNPESAQYAMGGLSYYPWFILIELAYSYFMTWIYNRTNGNSLISGYLFHGGMNVASLVILTEIIDLSSEFPTFDTNLFITTSITVFVLSVILIILTKGKLGYKIQDV